MGCICDVCAWAKSEKYDAFFFFEKSNLEKSITYVIDMNECFKKWMTIFEYFICIFPADRRRTDTMWTHYVMHLILLYLTNVHLLFYSFLWNKVSYNYILKRWDVYDVCVWAKFEKSDVI